MAASFIDDLPIELKGDIISYLDLPSLLQFRLVSRHINEISFPEFRSYFQTLQATFRHSALQRLIDISQNQDLANSVEHIRIVMPRTYSLTSPTDQTSTQEGASLRKIYKLSLAISRFKNCYSVGTEPTKTPWSLLGPPLDNEIKSASEKLQAIQQAFDICGRPLQELKTGFWGGACVSLTKRLTQSTRSNLRRLYIECGPSSRSGEKNLSLDLPSLIYLNLKQVPNHDLVFLKSQSSFPSLKELEINLSGGHDAPLTYLPDLIIRQPALQIVRISLVYSSAKACFSFAKFCHTFKPLKVFRLKFDELNYSTGGNQTSVEFDCTDAEDLDRLASFSRVRPFASNFAVDGPDVLENFDFDSFLHNTGDNDGDGGLDNMNFMTNFGNDGIEEDGGVQDDGGIEDPLSDDLEKECQDLESDRQATILAPEHDRILAVTIEGYEAKMSLLKEKHAREIQERDRELMALRGPSRDL